MGQRGFIASAVEAKLKIDGNSSGRIYTWRIEMNDNWKTIAYSQFLALCFAASLQFASAAHETSILEEPFDGTGDFEDSTGRLQGLHLPNWDARFDESLGGKNLDEGGVYPIDLDETGDGLLAKGDGVEIHDFAWSGGFIQRIEVRDLLISVPEISPSGTAALSFYHGFHPNLDSNRDRKSLTMSIWFDPLTQQSKLRSRINRPIPEWLTGVGENIALEMVYHADISLVEWRYDDDIDDSVPATELATEQFEFIEAADDTHVIRIGAGAARGGAIRASLDHFILSPLERGDFNYDLVTDEADLAILANDLRTNEPRRDLNQDSIVDGADRDIWVHDIAKTYYGDANLDGEFNTADLVSIFNFAQYEDDIAGNSTWETGDWNLDGDFTTTDLVLAFQDGGYEKGPLAMVPESTGSLVSLLCVLLYVARTVAIE